MLRLCFEYLGAAGLAVVAVYAFRARGCGSWRTRQFSWVAAAGSLYLAVDETFSLHERLGTALYDRGWREPAGINHLDDVLLGVIALTALLTAAFFVSEIRRDAAFARLFAAGLGFFALAIAWDAMANPSLTVSWWTEESLELGGVMVMAMGFRGRAARLHSDIGIESARRRRLGTT